MPHIDEEVLRRIRGEHAKPRSGRSYNTTLTRWAQIDATIRQLGGDSLSAFLDEVVSVFMSALESEHPEDQNDVLRARVSAVAEAPGETKKQRTYTTTDERWAVIDAVLAKHKMRNSSVFLNTAVDYFIDGLKDLPPDFREKPATQEQLRRAAEGLPRKSKK